MKMRVLSLLAALALLLSACGGFPSSETAVMPSENSPAVSTPAEKEPPATISAESPEPSEPPETDTPIDFDILQNCFISISKDTTIDDILSFIEDNSLFCSENEVTIDKTVYFKIAYEEGVPAPRYADSGDYIEISFDRANGDKIQYAHYVNSNVYGCSALYYNSGTWYHFRDRNAEDYSGYYLIKTDVESTFEPEGIVIKYENGNEVHTSYFLCGSPEEAVKSVIEELDR